MSILISIFLWTLGIYFSLGLVFGIFFLIMAPKVDPIIKDSKWTLRLLFFPGAVALWVFLLPKLFRNA